jgi:cysteine sulfinate desulfinase/cysteine desulfurase-like protein
VHKQLGTDLTHGGVRFSIGAFNTEAEVEAAITGVAEIACWAKERKLGVHKPAMTATTVS